MPQDTSFTGQQPAAQSYVDVEEEYERRRALLMEWLYGLQPGRCTCPIHPRDRRGDGRPSRLHSGCRWALMAHRALKSMMVSKGVPAAAWDRQFNALQIAVETMPDEQAMAS